MREIAREYTQNCWQELSPQFEPVAFIGSHIRIPNTELGPPFRPCTQQSSVVRHGTVSLRHSRVAPTDEGKFTCHIFPSCKESARCGTPILKTVARHHHGYQLDLSKPQKLKLSEATNHRNQLPAAHLAHLAKLSWHRPFQQWCKEKANPL